MVDKHASAGGRHLKVNTVLGWCDPRRFSEAISRTETTMSQRHVSAVIDLCAAVAVAAAQRE